MIKNKSQLLTFLFLSFSVGMVFVISISSGLLFDSWQRSLHFSSVSIGYLASSFFIMYSLLQVPAGMLVDYFGPKKMLGNGFLLASIALFVLTLCHGYYSLLACRIVLGAALSFNFVCLSYWVTHETSKQSQAGFFCLSESIAILTLIGANMFIAWALPSFGWELVLQICALVLFLGYIGTMYLLPENKIATDNLSLLHSFIQLKEVCITLFKDKQFIINAMYCGLVYSVLTVFLANWASPLFVHYYHINPLYASIYEDFMLCGLVVGGFLIYLFVTEKNLYRLMLWSPFVLMVAFTILMKRHFLLFHNYELIVLLLTIGICCSVYMLPFALASRFVSSQARATSVGLTNFIATGLAPIFNFIVAHYFRAQGVPIRIYANATALNWHYVLIVLSALFLTAFVLACFLSRCAGEPQAMVDSLNHNA
jgi:MFS family permease